MGCAIIYLTQTMIMKHEDFYAALAHKFLTATIIQSGSNVNSCLSKGIKTDILADSTSAGTTPGWARATTLRGGGHCRAGETGAGDNFSWHL